MVFNGKNMGKPSINGGFSIAAPWGKTRWKMLQSCVSAQCEKIQLCYGSKNGLQLKPQTWSC